jgi:hypothetical protein
MVADFELRIRSAVSLRNISARSVTALNLQGVDP